MNVLESNYLPPGKDVHTYAQEMSFVGLFICSFSTRGKEEETGKGAGGGVGSSVVQEKEGKGRETGRNRVVDKRGEGGGTMWKNRPVTTVQQACIGVSAMSAHWYNQSHCLISNK